MAGQQGNGKGEIFSKYLKHHLLPQIYFDLWPIAIGTMLILVIERGKVLSVENTSWISEWRILFEATSAYGTVGLSYDNP
jgi:Trk-type K+ transport system membrane component